MQLIKTTDIIRFSQIRIKWLSWIKLVLREWHKFTAFIVKRACLIIKSSLKDMEIKKPEDF